MVTFSCLQLDVLPTAGEQQLSSDFDSLLDGEVGAFGEVGDEAAMGSGGVTESVFRARRQRLQDGLGRAGGALPSSTSLGSASPYSPSSATSSSATSSSPPLRTFSSKERAAAVASRSAATRAASSKRRKELMAGGMTKEQATAALKRENEQAAARLQTTGGATAAASGSSTLYPDGRPFDDNVAARVVGDKLVIDGIEITPQVHPQSRLQWLSGCTYTTRL